MQLRDITPGEFTGQRVALFDIQSEHISPEYLEWLSDPHVNRYLESRFEAHSSSKLRDFVAACAASPSILLLGIRRLDTRRHIGNIKLNWDANHMRGDIGIMLGDTDSWQRGFATEAVALLTRLSFARLGMRKLVAGMYAGNLASLRIFSRCGYSVEATLKEHVILDGVPTDVHQMSMLRREYESNGRHLLSLQSEEDGTC